MNFCLPLPCVCLPVALPHPRAPHSSIAVSVREGALRHPSTTLDGSPAPLPALRLPPSPSPRPPPLPRPCASPSPSRQAADAPPPAHLLPRPRAWPWACPQRRRPRACARRLAAVATLDALATRSSSRRGFPTRGASHGRCPPRRRPRSHATVSLRPLVAVRASPLLRSP